MGTKIKSSALKANVTASTHFQDRLLCLDQKIQRLKEKREKLQIHQAILLTKEVQKILKDDFSPEFVLSILNKTWTSASIEQKKEWERHAPPFRFCLQRSHKKAISDNATLNACNVAENDYHALS